MTSKSALKKGPMTSKKSNLTYFDVFPEASIRVGLKEDKPEINAQELQQLVLATFRAAEYPKWAVIEHQSLIDKVVLVVLEGLDASRFNKYKEYIPQLAELSSKTPLIHVQAKEKGGLLVPAVRTLLGYSRGERKPGSFKSFEDMLLTKHQLIDNGYPLPVSETKEESIERKRFHYFHLSDLSEDDLSGYKELPKDVEGAADVISIDCEMILTSVGDEVSRLSVTDKNGKAILNEIYKPLGEVIDFRTNVSGITQEILDTATYSSNDAVARLGTVASQKTIIVGHSLENDFRALKLIHRRVIDTAIIYNRDVLYPRKASLSNLYTKYIKKSFRTGNGSHDSIEDAKAAMELASNALLNPVSSQISEAAIPYLCNSFFKRISYQKLLLRASAASFQSDPARMRMFVDENEESLLGELENTLKEGDEDFIFAYFQSLSVCQLNEEKEIEAVKFYNTVVENALKNCPPATVLMIYTANGNLKRLAPANGERPTLMPAYDPARKMEFELCRQGLLWINCYQVE